MMRASVILRRIVVPVENDPQQTHEHLPRGAKAVIDARAATRLSAVVGDGEFAEFAEFAVAVEEVAATGPTATAAAVMRRTAPGAAIGAATLACLWAGARMNHNFSDMAAHAAADGGSFGRLNAAASPMFGAGRDRGEMSGDPAMNLKNSARVAAMAVTAAVTANGALAGDAVQWRVADGGNGHWYQALKSKGPVTWSAAQDRAVSVNAHLATFELDGEFIAVVGPIAAETDLWIQATWWRGPWIGAYQDHAATNFAEPAGGWRWITGASVAPSFFSDFGNGNPNNYPCCEDYLQIGENPLVAAVNDVPESATAIALVVEWDTDCNNDNIVDYGQCHDGTLPDYNGNNIPDCCDQGVQCTVGNYPVQWRVEDGGNGHWYLATRPIVPLNWQGSIDACTATRGHLPTLASQAENNFVMALALGTWLATDTPTSGPFIGGRRSSSQQTSACAGWQWITNEPFNYVAEFPTGDSKGYGPCGSVCQCMNNFDQDEQVLAYWDRRFPVWNSCQETNISAVLLVEWDADCNNDNIVDYGQILNGTLADTNTNNIPDCCEPGNSCCLGDIYVNHIVDGGDLGVLLSEWGVVTPTTRSDLNRDGFVDGADLGRLLANWGPCGG